MAYTGTTTLTVRSNDADQEIEVTFEASIAGPEPDVGIMTSYLEEVTIEKIDGRPASEYPPEQVAVLDELLTDDVVYETLRPQFEKEAEAEIRAYEEMGYGKAPPYQS